LRRGGHGPVGRATASHHVEVARRHFRVPADGCIRVRTYSRSDVRTWVCGYEPPKLLCTILSTWALYTKHGDTRHSSQSGVFIPWRLGGAWRRLGSSKFRGPSCPHLRAASRDRCGGRGPSILHKAHKEVFQNAGNSMSVIVSVIGASEFVSRLVGPLEPRLTSCQTRTRDRAGPPGAGRR
jgi:hypothetical protein